jgi:hypothetical protein
MRRRPIHDIQLVAVTVKLGPLALHDLNRIHRRAAKYVEFSRSLSLRNLGGLSDSAVKQ